MYSYQCSDGHTFNASEDSLTHYIKVQHVGYFHFSSQSMAERAKKVEEAKGYSVTLGTVSRL